MNEIGMESTMVEASRAGDKTIDIRLGKPKYLKIREGEVLRVREDFWYEGKVLESLTNSLEIEVTQILYFETIQEVFSVFDFQSIVPTAQTAEEALKKYREYYSIAEERQNGVVAFTFEPVTDTTQ